MSKTQLTPAEHQVFNEFDRQGLLLGLPRLAGETNVAYKRRLFDVFVNRSNATYRGLINGITREIGLSIIDTLEIQPVRDTDGVPILPNPAILFEGTKCLLYSDIAEASILQTIDRWETDGGAWTINELVDMLNATGYWSVSKLQDVDGTKRSMTIFNQSSVNLVATEDVSGSGVAINLANNNLLEGSVVLSSLNLDKLVSTEVELAQAGTYLIKHDEGKLLCSSVPASGSTIRYKYRNDRLIVQSSPVILHSLQSDDFRTKMFEQLDDALGDPYTGRVTALGADIINELLSVYSTAWGK